MNVQAILAGVLPPLALALLGVSRFGARATGLAAALGALLAYGLLKRWPALPHELWRNADGTEWLLWCVLGVALLTLVVRGRRGPAFLVPALAAACAAGSLHLMLTKVASGWSGATLALHLGIAAIGVGAVAAAWQRTLRAAPQGMFPLVLATVVLSLDSGIATLGNSALLGQLCGAVAAAFGATAGARLWRKDAALLPGDALFFAFAHGAFLLAGVHVQYLPWTAAVIAGAAPLLALAVPRSWWSSRPRVAIAATSALVVLPLLVAILMLIAEQDQSGY
ncbi:MAG: hypothetical protein H6838_09350 [Planctomycetes bacterium]|nr:hypothetical protein [Planctomycetota bacterium]MCB9885686.1 hypothetical protein [Planctomycetota bacterium]